MRAVFFCHSVRSDWNNGNAHFQRGVMAELVRRGHSVGVWEPEGAWSAANLVADAGPEALDGFRSFYPRLSPRRYDMGELDLDAALDGAELVVVHEWTPPELVARIGKHRLSGRRHRLLFHDTHHRMATAPGEMAAYDFSHYDGILAFGDDRQRLPDGARSICRVLGLSGSDNSAPKDEHYMNTGVQEHDTVAL